MDDSSSLLPDWLELDDLTMEKIFEEMSFHDRFNASLVCRRWSLCFELPKVWRNIYICDNWLLKAANIKSNHTNLNHSFDYDRINRCLHQIGHYIRSISIRPLHAFANLYQMFVLLEWYFRNQEQTTERKSSTCNIQKLIFEFSCKQPLEEDPNGIKLFGIGGQLMCSFKKLLTRMVKLGDLVLIDLVLEKYEANSLMDLISLHLNESLRKFTAINMTIKHCPLQQITSFINLKVLKLSPQNIDNSMLQLIAESNIAHFHIIQNENTPEIATPCCAKAWSKFKQSINDRLTIHLDAILSENCNCTLLIQPEAPIHFIRCENVNQNVARRTRENYSATLMSYNEKSSANYDNDLIELVSECYNLQILELDRPITAGALLTIVAIGKSLQCIRIQKSCVVIKCEDWISEFCYNNNLNIKWVRDNAISIERVESAISEILKIPWHFSL